jgi:hypothetical protein
MNRQALMISPRRFYYFSRRFAKHAGGGLESRFDQVDSRAKENTQATNSLLDD